MQEHDNLDDALNVRALDVAERLLTAILAKVGPVMLTHDEYHNAPVPHLEAREHRNNVVVALITQFDAKGEPYQSAGYMPVDADHEPGAHVAYAEDVNDRLLTRTAGMWRHVEPTTADRARSKPWREQWDTVGPLTPLVAAYPPGVKR